MSQLCFKQMYYCLATHLNGRNDYDAYKLCGLWRRHTASL